jgi:hypothetical protein
VLGGCTREKMSGVAPAGPAVSRNDRTSWRAFSRSGSGNGVLGSSRSMTIESAPEV